MKKSLLLLASSISLVLASEFVFLNDNSVLEHPEINSEVNATDSNFSVENSYEKISRVISTTPITTSNVENNNIVDRVYVNEVVYDNSTPKENDYVIDKLIIRKAPNDVAISNNVKNYDDIAKKVDSIITYTVKKGDNLWSIANRYDTDVASIKKFSNLRSDTIYPGDVLKFVKGYKTPVTNVKKSKKVSYKKATTPKKVVNKVVPKKTTAVVPKKVEPKASSEIKCEVTDTKLVVVDITPTQNKTLNGSCNGILQKGINITDRGRYLDCLYDAYVKKCKSKADRDAYKMLIEKAKDQADLKRTKVLGKWISIKNPNLADGLNFYEERCVLK